MSPRAGLTRERVVDAAADLADADGLDALTLARLAGTVGVRTPSLYNHVDGLDDLHLALTRRALRLLGDRLRAAGVGRAGPDAVRAIAVAYRRFAHEHPGLYAATVPTTEVNDDQVRALGHEVVATVLAVFRAYGMTEREQLHATRTLRSAVHGFVSLELGGGFGIPVDVDETFDRMLDTLLAGFAGRATG